MAVERLRAILDAVWQGGKATAEASMAIAGVGKASEDTKKRMESLKSGAEFVGKAMGALAGGTKLAWKTIEHGAALELASSRFDKLTASIGSTSDTMLTRLREATHGMMSDAQLMASASQIISLGLMDTEDGVVRLASVVGELGWDMNQVILTFANNSKMRLDALGLSISDVDARTKAFVAAGMTMDEAFDLAVLEAGEARIAKIGSAAGTTAGDMKVLAADIANVKDNLLQMITVRAGPAIHLLADGFEKDIDIIIEAQYRAATSTEDYIELLRKLDDQSANMFKVGAGDAVREWTDTLVGELARSSTGVDDFKTKLQAAGMVIATEYGREIVILGNQHIALEVLLKNVTTAQQLNAAAIEEGRRATQEYNGVVEKRILTEAEHEATLQLVRAAMEDYNDTSADAYEARRQGIDSSEALRQKMEEEYAAMVAAEEAARALRIEFGGEFLSALMLSADQTVNFTTKMLEAAAAAGADTTALGLLAAATGEYTAEQIEAAIETAAMIQKAEELGAAVAAGNITVGEAILQFQDFRTELEQAVVPEIDDSDVTAAIEEAERLRAALAAASGTWTATFNIVQSGQVPPGIPSTPPGANPAFAEGTGGWLTVPPGYQNDTYPINLTSGERFAVVPQGESMPGGGGDTYNYYITPTYAVPTDEANLMQDIRAMELLRA